jgi:hypothetical protein
MVPSSGFLFRDPLVVTIADHLPFQDGRSTFQCDATLPVTLCGAGVLCDCSVKLKVSQEYAVLWPFERADTSAPV